MSAADQKADVEKGFARSSSAAKSGRDRWPLNCFAPLGRALRFAEHDKVNPASFRLWRRAGYRYRLWRRAAFEDQK